MYNSIQGLQWYIECTNYCIQWYKYSLRHRKCSIHELFVSKTWTSKVRASEDFWHFLAIYYTKHENFHWNSFLKANLIRNKNSLTIEQTANLQYIYIKEIKCWTEKYTYKRLSLNLSMISINMIKFHLVTASFNNKVTCRFWILENARTKWDFHSRHNRNVKSSSLNWSTLEKSQGLLCCGLLYCSCIQNQSTLFSEGRAQTLHGLFKDSLCVIIGWLYFYVWISCTPFWLAV